MNENVLIIRSLLNLLPQVIEAHSRFGSNSAFWASKREFLHFHSDSEIDVRVGLGEVARLKRVKEPGFAFRRSRSEWVIVDLDKADSQIASAAVRIAYERAVQTGAS